MAVGSVGVGSIGVSMCHHTPDLGYDVTVFEADPEAARKLGGISL